MPHVIDDPNDVVHPDDYAPVMTNPEDLGDGWDTADEGEVDDKLCEVPPFPMAALPDDFVVPPVKQVPVEKDQDCRR